MQLLWTILRILGILILALILLVLLVVSLVLFVPVRYQMWVKSREKLETKVRFHWLFHLISFTAEYRDELTYRLKILGITVYDEKSKRSVTDESNPDGTKEQVPSSSPEGKIEEIQQTSTPSVTSKESQKQQNNSLREKIEDIVWKIIDFLRSIPDKIAAVLEKWADIQENFGERVDAFIDKIDEWKRKTERLLKHIKDEQNRFAVIEGYKTIKKLIVHMRPRKLKVNGRLGFEDPALTGQIFAVIGMLMPLYGEHIQLEAVFDEKVIEVDAYLSGRARGSSMTYMILRLILRKEVRGLFEQLTQLKGKPQN